MALTTRQIDQLAESLEPAFRKAFLDAVAGMTNGVGVQLIADLLEAGRVDDVMQVLGLDEARFAPIGEALRASYNAGGQAETANMPKLRLSLNPVITGSYRPRSAMQSPVIEAKWDMRNVRAEAWVRESSSKLITGIVADQREAIRSTLQAGIAAGRGPRQTALDIVGRVGTTGRRSGGIVGLTSQQAGFVANMRAELADPAKMANYFTRTRRDKRFDGIVKRAMKAGKPVSAADIDKLVGRYADRLKQTRAEAIARTESLNALRAGQEEAYRQQIEAGLLDPDNVECTWSASGDERVRHSHAEMNGQKRKFGEPFQTPSGALLMFPGDESLGAGPEEIIQCRCNKRYVVNMFAEARRNG